MKIKNLFFTALFAFSAVTCQAGILSLTSVTIAVPTIYVGAKMYQADGDLTKTKRLIRQDKDVVCKSTIDAINKNCTNDFCKEIVKLLEQAKSTPTQIAEDKVQEAIEAAKETDAYKATHKECC